MLLVIVLAFIAYSVILAFYSAIRPRPPKVTPPKETAYQKTLRHIPKRITQYQEQRAQSAERYFEAVQRNSPVPLTGRPATRHPEADAWQSALIRNHLPAIMGTVRSATPTPSVAQEEPRPGVQFKDDEPRNLEDYIGQDHVVAQLRLHIRALEPDRSVLSHKLLTGLPGFGKTLLAKVVAHELTQRAATLGLPDVTFVETYAANLNSVEALDTVVRTLLDQRATVWFIDEIHVLGPELATKLYLLMEEQRYPFHQSVNPTPLPPVMVIGATTDYGRLHPALKRRFGEPLMLRPLSADELTRMASALLPEGTTPQAVADVVSRCVASGAPHELKTVAQEVQRYARATATVRITTADTQAVFALLDIDQNGLRHIDRLVLRTLARRPRKRAGNDVVYGASEADLCAVAGLDLGEFQRVVRPRLMARGYIEIRTGVGVSLTAAALRDYCM